MHSTTIPYLYDAIYRYKNYEGQARLIIEVLQELGTPEGALLELACGTGRYLEYLECYDRFGVDLCQESLMYAALRNPSAQLELGNMMAVSRDAPLFKRNQFDVILGLFGAIGYVPPADLPLCLQGWLSLLSPDGVLVLEPWHFDPEEGEFKQFYSSAALMVRRNATVSVKDGWTNMDFTFLVDHANGQREELTSTERLYSHPANALETLIASLGATIIQKRDSDFQEHGQWYIQKDSP